jgi:protease-4
MLFLVVLGGCVHVDVFPGGGELRETSISGEGPDKVLLIDISGALTTSKDSGLFSEPSLPARLKEEIMSFRNLRKSEKCQLSPRLWI